MDRAPRLICSSSELLNGATGVRFEVEYFAEPVPAFVVRHEGAAYGYLNRCGHLPMEMDFHVGEFFDDERRNLICSTHGAVYDTRTGACLGGPCGSSPLVALEIEERSGSIFYLGIRDE